MSATMSASTVMKRWDGVKGGVYYLVDTMPKFFEFLALAQQQSHLTIDTETSGLDWVKDHVAGFVFGWGVANNYYLPVAHKTNEEQLDLEVIVPYLQDLLNLPTPKIFWNFTFDAHMLRRSGIEIGGGVVHDAMIMSHLLDENSSHALKENACMYVDAQADRLERGIKQWRIDESKRRRAAFQVMLKDQSEKYRDDINILKNVIRITNLDTTKKPNIVLNQLVKERAKEDLLNVIEYKNTLQDISYDYIPVATITPYACADTHYTWLLYKKFILEIISNKDLKNLYINESRLTLELFETESAGIKIDRKYLTEVGPRLEAEARQFEQEIWDDVGYEFAISSDDQVAKALTHAGVKLTKLTKGSQNKLKDKTTIPSMLVYSVDKDVLDNLAAEYPFADKIKRFRGLEKRKSTYVDQILHYIDARDFLHTRFHANMSTGRMSSSNPNIQNIEGNDKTIKRAFIKPNDEYLFVFADASQIELRLTAHHSQDPTLLSCYPASGLGRDVHSITCAEIVLGISLAELETWKDDTRGHDPEYGMCTCKSCLYPFYRTAAKRVNFGIVYGCNARTLQRQISTPSRRVSEQECQVYIDNYFNKYYGVREWMLATNSFVSKHGYIQNSFGRYRRLPDAKSTVRWMKERALRQGNNFLIQGDAADLFKIMIVRVGDFLRSKKAKTHTVNFVHDEIQFYWHKDELHLIPEVKAVMEDFHQFSVPIRFDFSTSEDNWANKKSIIVA